MGGGHVGLLCPVTTFSYFRAGWYLTAVSWVNSTTLSVSLVSANFSVSVIKMCSQPSFICSQVRQIFIIEC